MKYIHVNVLVIRHNKKYDNKLPACRVQEGTINRYCQEVKIHGPSEMIYSPDKPLACGAKLWIQTEAEVTLIGETTWKKIQSRMKELTTK